MTFSSVINHIASYQKKYEVYTKDISLILFIPVTGIYILQNTMVGGGDERAVE